VDVGVVISREKDREGNNIKKQLEIDFIATMGSNRYYIQSAYAIPNEEKYEQETNSLLIL
jgi:predicted AAA+ superfamily ATPase